MGSGIDSDEVGRAIPSSLASSTVYAVTELGETSGAAVVDDADGSEGADSGSGDTSGAAGTDDFEDFEDFEDAAGLLADFFVGACFFLDGILFCVFSGFS